MQFADFDILLNALVGISGLKPALEAIKNGKTVALANKECLVAAGHLIMQLSRQHNALILPVDSEQTAIHQCLQGENPEHVEKIVLTASGGPFRGMTKAQLEKVTATEALKHPNWNMGDKISIDSATMMNKGMEVIASRWLFDLTTEQIEVVHHPQSVVHALVQFIDGSMKAQLSQPDMRLPVQYALFYPDRSRSAFPRLNFREQLSLTFRQINPDDFPCMQLATEASAIGGNIPCAMNAANEVAVQAFLQQKIGFLQIPDIIRQCMENATYNKNPGLDDIIKTDRAIQTLARDIIKTIPPPNR